MPGLFTGNKTGSINNANTVTPSTTVPTTPVPMTTTPSTPQPTQKVTAAISTMAPGKCNGKKIRMIRNFRIVLF